MNNIVFLRDVPATFRPWRQTGGASGSVEIILDLSRLLSRVLHPTPTGVDRVEMAYALGLLRLVPERLTFAATHPCGLHGRLLTKSATEFLQITADRWSVDGHSETSWSRWRHAAKTCLRLIRHSGSRPSGASRVYLQVSPNSLERRRLYQNILRQEKARLVVFIHDLIPLEYPEYARPDSISRFQMKIQTAVTLGSGFLVNSNTTARALQPHLRTHGCACPIQVAPLGISHPPYEVEKIDVPKSPPYFLALSTIEPRKNHLLLLHIWRRLITIFGPEEVPRLIIVGRRGWENEMVLDLLDRTPTFPGIVQEHRRLSDRELNALLKGACALLHPSFAEGYGLPVAESLALGTPVIASTLSALREVGGDVPEYLDPLDGSAWIETVLEYARPGSPRRRAQLERLGKWRAPTWNNHLETALAFIDEICR